MTLLSGLRRSTGAALVLLVLATPALCGACGGGGGGGVGDAKPSTPPSGPPEVQAWSGIVIERASGRVLWSKTPDRQLPPASCTKIMTALLTLEHVRDLDAYATVPQIPLPQKVGVNLRPGDRISVREALYALMVKSANDAALTLASFVGGSERAFVRLMNARAAELRLRHTHFKNCRGTPEEGHYSCARDLATLGRVAMRDATFRRLVRTKKAVIRYPPDAAVPVENHNRLLDYEWADGIKTGATAASGKVLVGSGKPGPIALIVVTMHEPTREQEVRDAVALFEWATAQYAGGPVTASPSSSR